MTRVIQTVAAAAALPLLVAGLSIGCGSSGNGASPGADGGQEASPSTDSGTSAGDDATAPQEGGGGPGLDGGADVDAWKPLPPTPDQPQLWYWHSSYLSPTSTTEPAASEKLIDQAVAAGYTGLAFWDSALTFANRQGWSTANLATVVKYAQSKGLTVLAAGAPIGYSNDMLEESDPNLAEGAKIVGGQFTVSGGALVPVNTLAPLQNPGFESGQTVWFNTGDARTGVDTTVAHSGSASGVINGDPTATDNARLTQAMTVTPWRLYHIQLWFKTSGFSGNSLNVEVLDFTTQANNTLTRMGESPTISTPTQDWTVFDYAFNSRESTQVSLYIGVWGGFSGTVWIDDVLAEETSLVNVLRRTGTPLEVYDSSRTYTEGTDYATVADPALAAHPGTYDPWHTPPSVAVPSGSQLQSGATVSMDYFTIVPQIGWEVSSCLTDPAIQTWNKANAQALQPVFPKGTGVFMGYDEMRQGDSCDECRATNLTGGQLLARNVQQTVQTLQGVWGADTPFYFWDDMFSPYHNAVNDYYDVEGDLTGSWTGLPPGSVIMNWNPTAQSLKFFTGTDTSVTPAQPHAFQQIIAGYYDSGDGATSATQEIQAAMGIKGLTGLMYTTWVPDYSQMAAYATAAKAAWPAYKASAP